MAELQHLVERLEMVARRLEAAIHPSALPSPLPEACRDVLNGLSEGPVASSVEAFDKLLAGPVVEYIMRSREIGADVQVHADMVQCAWKVQRTLLLTASCYQGPSEKELADVLKPMAVQIEEVQMFREKNRGSSFFNHLSAVSEAIPALGWVAISQTPGPYIKEMNDAAMFYTNRVLKEFKDKDRRHLDWVKAFLSMWQELQSYIKEFHTTGLLWTATGIKMGHSSSASIGPPPPPPPPPPPSMLTEKAAPSRDHSALFAQINQGENISLGLKHVADEQKTHKNPGIRGQGVRPSGRSTGTTSGTPQSLGPEHPRQPLLLLEGKKWRVEYQDGSPELLIEDTTLAQVVYIFQCSQSTLQIKGKVNSIVIDNCAKFALVFESVVGMVEVINSRNIQVQVTGKVPTISVNKTDGFQLFLSSESLDCEIISAKSSEMNVVVPQDDDFREFPVPEQFKTIWNGHKLISEATEIAG
uniref:Cyclase associated actin cytoskeleton regulatory protein 1 n=1 Tax=Eptatretus burgeri TaxID=7764 RepID=A0A8C4NGR1_EPTBU